MKHWRFLFLGVLVLALVMVPLLNRVQSVSPVLGMANVLDFGAKCDGVTDDTVSIQNALNYGGRIYVPQGACRFTSQLVLEKAQTLEGMGYSAGGPAATVLLKDGNFDGLLVGMNSQVKNLEVNAKAGNGGDGIYMIGGRNVLENVDVVNQGGVGVRIGDKVNGNSNLWRINNLVVRNNGSHGLFISAIGEYNANAGILVGLDARTNGGDGLRIDRAIDNQFFGLHAAQNQGYGIYLTGGAYGHSFWMPYVEWNVQGGILLDAGSRQNVVWGTRQGVVGDDYEDRGDYNLVLGRDNKSSDWNLNQLTMQQLRLSNLGVSGAWELKQMLDKAFQIGFVDSGASPVDVDIVHDNGGTVNLNIDATVPTATPTKVPTSTPTSIPTGTPQPTSTPTFTSTAVPTQTGVILIDSYSEINQNSLENLLGTWRTSAGQSFMAKATVLDSVKFVLQRIGNPTGTAVAKLYSQVGVYGTSSLPSTLLATSDPINVSAIATGMSLVPFKFSGLNRVGLQDKPYIAVVEYLGGSGFSNDLRLGEDSTNPTHSGNAVQYMPSSGWSVIQGADVCFYVYGIN